jgi:hypothetical protein
MHLETREFSFGHTENIDIEVLANHCEITESTDGGTHIQAQGDEKFIRRLHVLHEDGSLRVKFKSDGVVDAGRIVDLFAGGWASNRIAIQLPTAEGDVAKITLNGSGKLVSHIKKFHHSKLTVNGSGDVVLGRVTGTCATLATSPAARIKILSD